MAKESGESVAEQNAEALNKTRNSTTQVSNLNQNRVNTSTVVNNPTQVQTVPVQNIPNQQVKQVVVNNVQNATQIPRPQVVTLPPVGSN